MPKQTAYLDTLDMHVLSKILKNLSPKSLTSFGETNKKHKEEVKINLLSKKYMRNVINSKDTQNIENLYNHYSDIKKQEFLKILIDKIHLFDNNTIRYPLIGLFQEYPVLKIHLISKLIKFVMSFIKSIFNFTRSAFHYFI